LDTIFKSFKLFIITILLLCVTILPVSALNNDLIFTYSLLPQVETTDRSELKKLINECQDQMDKAENLKIVINELNYSNNHLISIIAEKEYNKAYERYCYYENEYNNIVQSLYDAYPAASQIWLYLKEYGYNDYVCAGIMGNIMAEVGGQTLNIQYTLSTNNYYGICQWSSNYSSVWGTSLQTQLDFLTSTVEKELNTYGRLYSSGFDYDDFINLTDEKAAALAFAKCYERCGSGSYSIRQQNATAAYNYFVD
jgi:hypothetical protein